MLQHATREEWLTAAIDSLRPVFAGFNTLPLNIRVTCGFPRNSSRTKALGECWPMQNSRDKVYEILISPTLDDPLRVFDVLIHELCHTLPGCMNHGVTFGAACSHMGLVPATSSWKSTVAGPDFFNRYAVLIESLGSYPHAALDISDRKVAGTRLLKAICPHCGYTARITEKWLARAMPTCTPCGVQFVRG